MVYTNTCRVFPSFQSERHTQLFSRQRVPAPPRFLQLLVGAQVAILSMDQKQRSDASDGWSHGYFPICQSGGPGILAPPCDGSLLGLELMFPPTSQRALRLPQKPTGVSFQKLPVMRPNRAAERLDQRVFGATCSPISLRLRI